MYRFSTKGIRSKRIHIDANGLRVPLLTNYIRFLKSGPRLEEMNESIAVLL